MNESRIRILFVCTANICRSAFAAVLGQHLSDRIECSSAGVRSLETVEMDTLMARELAARGADPTSFRSRALTRAMVTEADLVITMEVEQRMHIVADMPDLVGKVYTLAQFAGSTSRVAPELTGPQLLAAVRLDRGYARSSDDVPDPHGRGRAAAAAAAARIEHLLRSFLSRL